MPEEDTRPTTPVTRSPAVIRAELADLERFLAETPPHHGAGVRQALESRRARLQQELARATR